MRGQRAAVIKWLKSGNSLTSKEAYENFGITRLAAIIHDLKEMGYSIHTIMVDGVTRYGDSCKYAKYIMSEEPEE